MDGDNDLRRGARRASRLLVLLVAVAGIGFGAYAWYRVRKHPVVFKASACHPATVRYTERPPEREYQEARTRAETVSTPWQSETLSFTKGSVVSIIVTDFECANVHCEAWVDGKLLRQDTGPTAVECGGVL
jgi:hypothetical protein